MRDYHSFISDCRSNIPGLLGKMGLEKIALEDTIFGSEYEVYSDDQIKARRLLTPAFMERLIAMPQPFDHDLVTLSARDDQIFIAIPYFINPFTEESRQNLFEAPDFDKKLDFSAIQGLAEEIGAVLSMIDHLQIQTRQ